MLGGTSNVQGKEHTFRNEGNNEKTTTKASEDTWKEKTKITEDNGQEANLIYFVPANHLNVASALRAPAASEDPTSYIR